LNKTVVTVSRKKGITQDWEFNSHKEGKKEKRKKKELITTRGIRIWSPIQGGTPPNRAYM